MTHHTHEDAHEDLSTFPGRRPAPPLVALIGLLGILVGEQIVPVGKQLLNGTAFVAACDKEKAVSHVFGQLPGRQVKDKDHS